MLAAGCKADNVSATRPEDTAQSQVPKTYVLVHGAWHGGWCWRDVRDALQDQGHRVFTPTLTGLADRSHLASRDVNLTTHVTDILNLLEFEDLKDVTLVGHSYAGLVVSLVADRAKERLSHIVYLDAVLPKDGEPFFPVEQHEAFTAQYADDYKLPVSGLEFLGIPEDHPKAEWVKSRLTPHPLGTFLEPVMFKNGGTDGLQTTFIRCTQNPRYKDGDPVKDMILEKPDWVYRTIDSGHDAMVTAPLKLARMLGEI